MSVTFKDKLPRESEVTRMFERYFDGMILSRYHVFSTYNKYAKQNPQKKAGKILTKRLGGGDVELLQVIGLDAELEFYHTFKGKYQLVPSLDCGDHTDFVGMLNGQLTRFDVTTNVSSKQKHWKNYIRYNNQVVVEWDEDNNSWLHYKADNGLSKLICFGKEVNTRSGWEFQTIH